MLISNLIFLWRIVPKKRHKQFFLMIFLMLISSFSEIISIGTILPFLGVLTAPQEIFNLPVMQPLIEFFNISSPMELIFPLTLIFILAVVFAGAVRLTLLYATTRFTHALGADISIEAYRRVLYQKYSFHLAKNSSDTMSIILEKTRVTVNGVITPLLNILSSLIIITAVLSFLVFVDPEVAIISSIVIGILFLIVISYTKKKLSENSDIINSETTMVYKALQEGLGGIRDVIIDGTQEFYCKYCRKSDLRMRKAIGDNYFISQSPRFILESLGMSSIALFAYYIFDRDGSLASVIPILGTIALGAQRLLPLMNLVYSSFSNIKGSLASFEEVLNILRLPKQEQIEINQVLPLSFKKDVTLKDVSFRYNLKSPWILKNINLTIKKGATIGFIGSTGAGKTTLLDIIMGLLEPSIGEVLVDGKIVNKKNLRSWQANIAHVPQDIFLSDTTLKENIAFGEPKDLIDENRVRIAAQYAQIEEYIDGLKLGYDTFTGERGVRLSGGQRQRIGIARALYKQTNFLVFDEATSALDNQTEKLVMESLSKRNKNLTVLIIAHRLTTLKDCDYIVKIEGCDKVKVGSYSELVEN